MCGEGVEVPVFTFHMRDADAAIFHDFAHLGFADTDIVHVARIRVMDVEVIAHCAFLIVLNAAVEFFDLHGGKSFFALT